VLIYNRIMPESKSKTSAVPLDTKNRRALRARAHSLRPVVWISAAGATPPVLREIDRALTAHELIKIHAAVAGRVARESLNALICEELCAKPVQIIGNMLIVYRKRPEHVEAATPLTTARRPTKPTLARTAARRRP
jgi:putative YhbY family RNA-binding protein